MEDIVAVEVRIETGESRYFLTWGRIQDAVDPWPLAQVVLDRCRGFDLGGEPVSARVRWTLQPAANEPYFHECLFAMARKAAPTDDGFDAWRAEMDQQMRAGRELYYLGRERGFTEPDDPHAVVGQEPRTSP